jgi:hypothetical protein
MREYAWYSPELDIITFQSIMESCTIVFEFNFNDLVEIHNILENAEDPIQQTMWIPLGEL